MNLVIVYLLCDQNSFQIKHIPDISAHLESMWQVNVVIICLLCVHNSFQIIYIAAISAHLESMRQVNVVIAYLLLDVTAFRLCIYSRYMWSFRKYEANDCSNRSSPMFTKQLSDYIYSRYISSSTK